MSYSNFEPQMYSPQILNLAPIWITNAWPPEKYQIFEISLNHNSPIFQHSEFQNFHKFQEFSKNSNFSQDSQLWPFPGFYPVAADPVEPVRMAVLQPEPWELATPLEIRSNLAQNQEISQMLDQYCQWSNTAQQIEIKVEEISSEPTKKSRKQMLVDKFKADRKIEELLQQLDQHDSLDSIVTVGQKKWDRQQNTSTRRSTYIGLSKNGKHWQAMININKRKTYIGTYKVQTEGVKAYDFYAILLHGLKARVNLSYTKQEVLDMIWKFKDPNNNNEF